MATDDALIAAAKRFIDFYGQNGIVYGQNVSDFLSSIAMSTSFHSRLSATTECPNRAQLSALTWTKANASQLASLVLDGVQTPACYGPQQRSALQTEEGHRQHEYNPVHVWGYGLLFVTLINLCACVGIVFLPCMGRRVYKLLMTFMVSLAVGSLLSTGLLILLPESLQLLFIHEEVNKANSSLIERHHHHVFHGDRDHSTWEDFLSKHPWYLWRCCTVFGGIYMFFIIERLLKELIRWKDRHFAPYSELNLGGSDHHGHSHLPPSAAAISPSDSEAADLANFRTAEVKMESPAVAIVESASASELITESGEALVMPQRVNGGCGRGGGGISKRLAAVQPVAWMILLGDALHNFIDGLSIGTAFTRSTLSGVSICLAVLCEELPHELGDFAILLSAGMSMPMALLCNFLSACTCYLGFALGVLLGETGASVWVFAIATGMFLYISLVDMTPEVNQAMEDPEAKQLGRGKIFLLQNLGLFTGFSIILLLAVYGGNIALG